MATQVGDSPETVLPRGLKGGQKQPARKQHCSRSWNIHMVINMGKTKKKEVQEGSPKENKLPFSEALLAYHIEIKEEEIEQLLVQVKKLKEKNQNYQERNERLKKEQLWHIKNLLSEMREQDKKSEQEPTVTRGEIEEAMKEKWRFVKDQERNLEDMRVQVESAEKKYIQKRSEKEYLEEYKNVGSKKHASQISSLENEIQVIRKNTEEMIENFRVTVEETKKKIGRFTLKQVDEKKELATKKAVKNIDRGSYTEIKENDWLKKEVTLYRKEVEDLELDTHLLEEENVKLVNEMFECRLKDLRVPRHLFLARCAGLETHPEARRGKSEMEPLILRSKTVPWGKKKTLSFKLDSTDDSVTPREGHLLREDGRSSVSSASRLSYLLYQEEQDFKEYAKMGSLEVKFMCVEGLAMPIHQNEKEAPSRREREALQEPGSHITHKMVQSLL
ncbi:coiled-coil domain-containing protein 83 isoform X2 [Tachyglossus aculeatus]|uniref:coiled-coil domain-containing protein 83 isoform X2 n=1 Tax=Tachyglossus aculeatus TaxID=9261 RepID=UPI0018F59B4C|nr:coiled-coil domain-containing protein 83 isoform X2 [Tachyglossus aculeatus]